MDTTPLTAALAALRVRITRVLPAQIRDCVGKLTDEQIWWRPNEASNSIGSLLLHLSGNVRQWIVAGVGGAPDTRTRAAEFAAQQTLDKQALLMQLSATLAEVDAVLASLAAQTEAA